MIQYQIHCNKKNKDIILFNKQIIRLFFFFYNGHDVFLGGKTRKRDERKNTWAELNRQYFNDMNPTIMIRSMRHIKYYFERCCLEFLGYLTLFIGHGQHLFASACLYMRITKKLQ